MFLHTNYMQTKKDTSQHLFLYNPILITNSKIRHPISHTIKLLLSNHNKHKIQKQVRIAVILRIEPQITNPHNPDQLNCFFI